MSIGSFEGQKVLLTQNSLGTFIKLKITSNTPSELITDDVGTTYDFDFINNQEGQYVHISDELAKGISVNNLPVIEPSKVGDGGATEMTSFNAAIPNDFSPDWRV